MFLDIDKHINEEKRTLQVESVFCGWPEDIVRKVSSKGNQSVARASQKEGSCWEVKAGIMD